MVYTKSWGDEAAGMNTQNYLALRPAIHDTGDGNLLVGSQKCMPISKAHVRHWTFRRHSFVGLDVVVDLDVSLTVTVGL